MNFNECRHWKYLNLIVSMLSGKRSPDLFLNERNLQMGDYIVFEKDFKIKLDMHFSICTEGSAQAI